MFDAITSLRPAAGFLGACLFAYQVIASATSIIPQIPFGGVAVAACVIVWGVSLLAPPPSPKKIEKPKRVKKEFKYTNIAPTPTEESPPVKEEEQKSKPKKNKKTRRERELRKKEVEAAEAAAKAKEAKRLKKKNKKQPLEEDQGDWVTQQSTKEIIAARKASRVANHEEQEEKTPVGVTGTVSVPTEKHASIIGPGASNLRQIEAAFNVKISVPKKGSNQSVIVIKGPEEQIPNAKQCILDFAERGFSLSLMGDGAVEQPVTVTGKVIRNLVSAATHGGDKLLAVLESKTGCRIFLPTKNQREQSEAANLQSMATVVGQPEAVQSTIEALSQLSQRGYSDLTHPGWVQIQMAVDASMVGVVMGRKGERIANIQKSNNVSINFPNRESRERSEENSTPSAIIVTIQGAAEAVYRAQAEIARIQTSFVSMEIEFPANLLGSLRGPGGKNLASLSQMGVRVNVGEHLWDPSLKVITFTGLKNDIAQAEASFRSSVARNTFEIVEVPESCMGLLIGKKGENVKRIQNSSGCHINVREHDWDDSVKEVVISGPHEGVQRVVEEVRKMAVRPVYIERSAPIASEGTQAAS